MQTYSTLTNRYLLKHRGRTILTLIGIIIAIAMFTAIGSIYYSTINGEIERTKAEGGDYEAKFFELNKEKVKVISINAEIENGGVAKEEGILHINNELLTDSLKELSINSYDAVTFKDVFRVQILEGRLPVDSSEIIVDKKFYAILKDKQIGDVLTGELNTNGSSIQTQYKIVGSYESKQITNYALSYLDITTAVDDNSYSYFANIKQEKGKVDIASNIAKANSVKLDVNSSLLYLYGDGPNKNANNDMNTVFGVIVAFVVLCTVVVIYNAFNISVMERIKHFGILRSIGATKPQIRKLVLKEALIMSVISIPIGIIAGLAGITITFNIFMDNLLGFYKVGLYPQVILGAIILGLFTVFCSAFFPARTASKVSPIDAIRGTMVVKGDRIKRRSGFLVKLIFNFEGQVAYKNIKRSRKRFYITCISLMISLIMFVFFSNFFDVLIESNEIVSEGIKIEGAFTRNYPLNSPYLNESIIKDINSLNGIKEKYELNYSHVPCPIDKDKVNSKFADKLEEYKNKYIVSYTDLLGYDEACLDLFNKENNTNINFQNFSSNNEIIIFDKSIGTDQENTRFYDSFTKYKVGDTIELPVLNPTFIEDPYAKEGEVKEIIDSDKTMTFKVIGVVDYETINHSMPFHSYGMIMSINSFEKLTGIENRSMIGINFESPEYREQNFEKLNIIADENNVRYTDIYNQKKQSEDIWNQLKVLVYGFISLIVLISTVNIINTVTINLLVKKREYATFKAIGMTKGQFKKLVLLEGALFGIIACVVGLPLSFVLTYFGLVANNPVGSIGYTSAVWPYVYGGIGIIILTLVAALFPLRKLNDMNIVEALRIEE